VSDLNDEHPLKQLFSRDLTEFGMNKNFKCMHSKNHLSGKYVTMSFSVIASIDLFKIVSFPKITWKS
jgi:hypothetical protein